MKGFVLEVGHVLQVGTTRDDLEQYEITITNIRVNHLWQTMVKYDWKNLRNNATGSGSSDLNGIRMMIANRKES